VEHELPRVDPHLREHDQHPRGRHARGGLQEGAHQRGEPLRAGVRVARRQRQGQGPDADGRGHPRGPDRHHLGQAGGPQFEGQTKTKLGNTPCAASSSARATSSSTWFEEHPAETRQIIVNKAIQGARAPGRRRPRAHPAQGVPGLRFPARQARRLPVQGPGGVRDLRRRGRQRRRVQQDGARPGHPGDPADPRQDPQRREGTARQDPREQGDPGADHRDRHRDRRGVRPLQGPLPQGRHADGRRRRRRPHPHARAHLPVPAHEGTDRRRLRLHRAAAPVLDPAGGLEGQEQDPLRVQRP
jgi:hypothetical protein